MERTLLTARSVEFDALVVAGGWTPGRDIKLVLLLQEAFRPLAGSGGPYGHLGATGLGLPLAFPARPAGQVRCRHRSRAGGGRPAARIDPGGAGAGDGPPDAGAAFEGDGQPVGVLVVARRGGGDAGHSWRAGDEQLLEFCWCHRGQRTAHGTRQVAGAVTAPPGNVRR